MDLASLYFGLFLGIFVFTQTKIVQQTTTIWKHKRSLVNAYVVMIWVEAWVNFVFALITYLFLNNVIPGSVAFYLVTVVLWAIQTQLLLQIIANRVSLIMVDKRKARMLKWALFACVACINIAVAAIWIPAQLPTASPYQHTLNIIFEKAEKSFFLVVDLSLNLYFLYLVRFRLIADGLNKYWMLFKFNVAIVFLSTSMDILLLGFLSLPDPYLYVQFAPTAYIVKLHIELSMAALITKIVRKGSKRTAYGMDGSSKPKSNPGDITSRITSTHVVITGPSQPKQAQANLTSVPENQWWDVEARGSSSGSETCLSPSVPSNERGGIVRTVETMVVVDQQ